MKFKQFLEFYVQQEQIDPFAPFRKNIKTVLDKKIYFLRGDDSVNFTKDPSGVEFDVRPARTIERVSIYGNDVLRLIASKWDGLPDRSKSYFASRSTRHAAGFGSDELDVALVIPADNIKSFAWSPSDFNESDDPVVKHLQKLTYTIHAMPHDMLGLLIERSPATTEVMALMDKFAIRLNDADERWSDSNFERRLKFFDELMKNLPNIQASIRGLSQDKNHLLMTKTFLRTLDKASADLEKLGVNRFVDLPKVVTPETMNIAPFSNFSSASTLEGDKDELWFEGSYLAVRWDEGGAIEHLRKLL